MLVANPKDICAIAENKVNLALVPNSAIAACARALMDGAKKYGAWNWRKEDSGVDASVYVAACRRHLAAWFDGEECATDSGVHHLGAAMASLAILLDAQEFGCLNDDRPQFVQRSYLSYCRECRASFTSEKALDRHYWGHHVTWPKDGEFLGD
jgi:hypothetical protein